MAAHFHRGSYAEITETPGITHNALWSTGFIRVLRIFDELRDHTRSMERVKIRLEESHRELLNQRMSLWTAIVLIVAIVFAAEIARSTMKGKGSSKAEAAMAEKMKALEERIASLESIAVERDREAKFRDLG